MQLDLNIYKLEEKEKMPQGPILPRGTARENGFYLIYFLIVCLGGAVRKWGTSSSAVGNGILLVQMVMPFMMFFFRSSRAASPFSQYGILGLLFFYLVAQIFNPLQLTLYHGILGVLVYGALWLALFFYLSNRHLFNSTIYIKTILVISLIEIVLAFIQYQLPYDNILNRYSDESKIVATIGDRVRVTGTFSYLGGFTGFLVFFPFFIWALIRLRYNAWLVSTASVFGLFAAFMSGSRGGTFLYLALMIPIFIHEFTVPTFIKFGLKLILPLLVGFTMLLIAGSAAKIGDQIGAAYNNFFDRVKRGQESGEQSQRLLWDLSYFQNNNFKSPVFGIGTGATYQGATILFGKSPNAIEFGYVENEPVKIALEGGIVMVALKIILATIVVLNLSFKSYIRWVVWFILVYASPIVFNVHNAAFLFLGISLVDNIIWRQKVEAAQKRRAAAEGLVT